MTVYQWAKILWLVVLIIPPISYLLVQLKSPRFHFHWLGLLTILWLIPSYLSVFLPLLGKHNLIMLSYCGLLIYLWVVYFLKFNSRIWNYSAMTFIVLLFSFNIYLKGGGVLDYSALSFNSMFLPSFMVFSMLVALFRLLITVKQEHNLLNSTDYWIYSALLFYFVFIAILEFFGNLGALNSDYMRFTGIALLSANLIFALFFVIGIRKWWKSLQVK